MLLLTHCNEVSADKKKTEREVKLLLVIAGFDSRKRVTSLWNHPNCSRFFLCLFQGQPYKAAQREGPCVPQGGTWGAVGRARQQLLSCTFPGSLRCGAAARRGIRLEKVGAVCQLVAGFSVPCLWDPVSGWSSPGKVFQGAVFAAPHSQPCPGSLSTPKCVNVLRGASWGPAAGWFGGRALCFNVRLHPPAACEENCWGKGRISLFALGLVWKCELMLTFPWAVLRNEPRVKSHVKMCTCKYFVE